jgi:hypothetical protein
MSADIVILVRFNNISRIRQSKIGSEDTVTYALRAIMNEFEAKIKDLTTEVVEVYEEEQRAMDIGRDILKLIEDKAKSVVEESKNSGDYE